MSYSRFAIYFVPSDGALARFGASWLGWDIARGQAIPQTDIAGLRDITMTPAKYGFHGTLKPPFRLVEGMNFDDLRSETAALARGLAPAECGGLELTKLGHFLALTPTGDVSGLSRAASAFVEGLDHFRAAPSDAELERRRKASLTAAQEANLMRWGYPYVKGEFRFHLTLSGKLPPDDLPVWFETLNDRLPPLPKPFVVDSVALCGERMDGRFEVIHRYTLDG